MSKTRTVVGISIVIAVALVAAATVQPAAQRATATPSTTATLDIHNAADNVQVTKGDAQVTSGQVQAGLEIQNTGQSATTVTVQAEAYRGSTLLPSSVDPDSLELAPSESLSSTVYADTGANRIEVYVKD